MKVKMIRDGEATVALTAEECEVISHACNDAFDTGSTTGHANPTYALARAIGSLPDAILLTVDAE